MAVREFLPVKQELQKFPELPTVMPIRADLGSAGYDFFAKEQLVLRPGESHVFWTDVCIKIPRENVLLIDTRSGNGVKRRVTLSNTIGVIDSSYVNAENGGNIGVCLENNGTEDFKVFIGDRIAQGIITSCFFVDNDNVLNTGRTGGFGSSGK